MYAARGRLLSVDLNTRKCTVEAVAEKLYRQYLGGYGLGVALLLERMDPACDPLGPENILGFAAGYLTGTGAYIASRFMAFGKSPSTGGWGDANCGGHFGPKLKKAGLDVILISGRAGSPVYLLVLADADGAVQSEILDSSDLWGKDCYRTEDLLKERHGKESEVVCIGPAGENLAAVAGISTDKGRFAARSALGAVMGSKKLKAVVVKGNASIRIADPEGMKALRKQHLPVFKEEFGTPMFYEEALNSGDAPWKNWSSSVEEMQGFSVTAEKVKEYQLKRYACSGCPVGCGGHVEVKQGPFKTEGLVHKVEYETMGMFGSNLLTDNLEAMIRINDLCNRYGLDTIGTGALVAYATECYERGLIGKEQTDGLELGWGRAEAAVALVEKIGKAEGIGAILAKGFDEAVRMFGRQGHRPLRHGGQGRGPAGPRSPLECRTCFDLLHGPDSGPAHPRVHGISRSRLRHAGDRSLRSQRTCRAPSRQCKLGPRAQLGGPVPVRLRHLELQDASRFPQSRGRNRLDSGGAGRSRKAADRGTTDLQCKGRLDRGSLRFSRAGVGLAAPGKR